MEYTTRLADLDDIPAITRIYNQGIQDRTATLETRLRSEDDMKEWYLNRGKRYKVLVITDKAGTVVGWASLNLFNSRDCYSGVADISIYIERNMRGKGLGRILLDYLEKVAADSGFHKLVLNTFDSNEAGKRLYKSKGFREVGTYIDHGILEGKLINITVMEKLLGRQECR